MTVRMGFGDEFSQVNVPEVESAEQYVRARKAEGCICTWDGTFVKSPDEGCPLHGFAAGVQYRRHDMPIGSRTREEADALVASCGEVDSLDAMQPVPRAGKFFATRILREEVRTGAGVILQEGDDPNQTDMRTMRARVDQLGDPRDGDPWDFAVGFEVIVPYHAGHKFSWMSQEGVTETLWIVDTQEVIAIFKPRPA